VELCEPPAVQCVAAEEKEDVGEGGWEYEEDQRENRRHGKIGLTAETDKTRCYAPLAEIPR
jgi:hypothetical protein